MFIKLQTAKLNIDSRYFRMSTATRRLTLVHGLSYNVGNAAAARTSPLEGS